MCWSKYLFEVGLTLINSLLINSILVNSEAAYNLTLSNINQLEKCHERALRELLSLPVKSPKPMLYLLTGSIPIKYKIKQRRLVYLHDILSREEGSLINRFFKTQLDFKKSKDWASQILKDLMEYEIEMTMDEIKSIGHDKWKDIIKSTTKIKALDEVNNKQGSKSMNYDNLKLADFLCPRIEKDIPI